MHRSHQLERAVLEAYAAGACRLKWQAILGKLREAFRATTVKIALHDHSNRSRSGWELRCGSEAPLVDSPWDQHAWLDRLPQDESWERRPGQCWLGEDVARSVRRQASACDVLKPEGHGNVLHGVIDREGSAVTYIVVWRDRDAEPFRPRELDALAWVARRLRAALRVAQDFEDERLRSSACLATLDSIAQPAILTDGQHWWHGNRKAKRLLAGSEGLRLRRGTLEAATPAQSEKLRGLLRDACDSAAPRPGTLALSRGPDRRPLLLTFVPVSRTRALFNERQRYVVLLIGDPEARERPEPLVLQQWFGLTPAEAKLAALLTGGHRLDEAALELGISVGTARNHLKSTFAKTETHRQADLIALLASVPIAPIAGESGAVVTAHTQEPAFVPIN